MPDLSSLPMADVMGYIGGLITIWAMYGKTIIPLRIGVVCGNVGLLVFGVLAESYPTLALHTILLPLNAVRLYQMIKVVREMRESAAGDGSLEPLVPFMRRETAVKGTELFHKGDPSDRMIIIETGTVCLVEIDHTIGPGDVLGEIGAFTPDNKRTCTAVCKSDCVLQTLNNDMLLRLYYQNPTMGLALVRIIVGRLLENWQEADARARAAMS